MTHLSRILAAVDFSKVSHGAFEHALALSQQHHAELVVVHAVPPDQPFSWHAPERLALTARLRQRAAQAQVPFRMKIQQGDPAEIVLLHARTLRPDVIVVGTHQRRGIERLRAGSVGARIAMRASVPVLLVPRRRETGTIRPFSHVAVAVDFSASSKKAIDQAAALTSDTADRVALLHVVPGFSSGVPAHFYRYGLTEYQGQLVRDARQRLQLAVPAGQQTPATVEARVLVGDTTTEISRVVDSIGADLLVVGVPTRRGISRALFGTTAARLVRASRVPVLAVPEAGTARGYQEAAALPIAA